MSGATPALLLECAVIVAFLLISVIRFKISRWFLVAGLASHGVFDSSTVTSVPPDLRARDVIVCSLRVRAVTVRPVC